jgi:hypothetical protein
MLEPHQHDAATFWLRLLSFDLYRENIEHLYQTFDFSLYRPKDMRQSRSQNRSRIMLVQF